MAQRYTEEDMHEIDKLREMGLSWSDVAKRMGRISAAGVPNGRGVMEHYLAWKKARNEPIPAKKPIYDDIQHPVDIIWPTAAIEIPKIDEPIIQTSGINPSILPASGSSPVINGPVPNVPLEQPKRQHFMVVPPSQKKLRSLESMSRKERFDYITRTIHDNPRSKHVFLNILNQDEQEIFLHEYSQILLEQDSLTNAEEQQLFNAILNLVLYYRARARDTKAYEDYAAKKTQIYDSRWQDEATNCHKVYSDTIKGLKLSREQRLKDMARSGNTFLDYVENFVRKEQQISIADEIMELAKSTEAELKRLQENGWVIFGRSATNSGEVKYEQ